MSITEEGKGRELKTDSSEHFQYEQFHSLLQINVILLQKFCQK